MSKQIDPEVLMERRRRNNALPSSVAARKRWKERNREKLLAQQREYNMRPEVVARRTAFYKRDRAENPDKYRSMAKESFQRNRQKIYDAHNRLMKSSPNSKVAKRTRTYIWITLKRRCVRNEDSFYDLVGCTPAQLKAHLESHFKPGMTWDNWTVDGWHVDHTIPLAAFDLTIKEQRLKAFHFSNLKPEWAEVNLSKNSRHDGRRWRSKDHLLSPGATDQAWLEQPLQSCTNPAPALNLPHGSSGFC